MQDVESARACCHGGRRGRPLGCGTVGLRLHCMYVHTYCTYIRAYEVSTAGFINAQVISIFSLAVGRAAEVVKSKGGREGNHRSACSVNRFACLEPSCLTAAQGLLDGYRRACTGKGTYEVRVRSMYMADGGCCMCGACIGHLQPAVGCRHSAFWSACITRTSWRILTRRV